MTKIWVKFRDFAGILSQQSAAGDRQLLHDFAAADQPDVIVQIHHRADVVGIELHLVAHPDGFPEGGVVDDGGGKRDLYDHIGQHEHVRKANNTFGYLRVCRKG